MKKQLPKVKKIIKKDPRGPSDQKTHRKSSVFKHRSLTGDQHQTQGVDIVSMEEATVCGEASCLPAQAKGQTIKHHTKAVPAKPQRTLGSALNSAACPLPF